MTGPALLEARFGAPNYAPLLITIARGFGVYVRDESGRRYIDMMGHTRQRASVTAIRVSFKHSPNRPGSSTQYPAHISVSD